MTIAVTMVPEDMYAGRSSSDFIDPELPSVFRSTDRAEDRVEVCAKCPEDFLDKQYDLNHFVKPCNSRYFKTYPEDCSEGSCEGQLP